MPPDSASPQELDLYRSIFKLSMLGVGHMSPDGVLLWTNEAFASILGYEPEEMVGRRSTEFIHPDEREAARERIAYLFEGKVSHNSADRRYLHKDGHYIWANVTAGLVRGDSSKPPYLVGVIQDVSERKRQELAVRDSEARLRLVVESGRIGLWEADLTTGKVTWSKVFSELIGAPPGATPSRDYYYQFVHPEDRERVMRDEKDLFEGKRRDFSMYRVVHPDGTIRWIQSAGLPVRLESESGSRMIGAIIDVTEAREAETIIESQRAKMAAAAKMSALGEMAGGLAHEINNPVAIIHGNAVLLQQLAMRGKLAPELMQQTAKVIATTAERIAKITRSLLAFARDADHDPIKRASVRGLVEETAEFCRERFHGHGISFTIEAIDPALDIECRPVQVSQVLLNLLNNAHDAIEGKSERWIRIRASDEGDRVEIRVTDSGPGIPPELRERIFQPFFTTKEVGKGTGLGLSVASGIAESHGGSLRLDSTAKNTSFVMSLPRRQPPKNASQGSPGLSV